MRKKKGTRDMSKYDRDSFELRNRTVAVFIKRGDTKMDQRPTSHLCHPGQQTQKRVNSISMAAEGKRQPNNERKVQTAGRPCSPVPPKAAGYSVC